MDSADESDLETESLVSAPVSVDAAQEEHAVPSTVPASSGVLRAAGPVEVIPMFDGSADGSSTRLMRSQSDAGVWCWSRRGAMFLNLDKAVGGRQRS